MREFRTWAVVVCCAFEIGCADDPAVVTAKECSLFKGKPAAESCPKGTEAILADIDDGRKCCVENGVTSQQCEAVGGVARADPGDGSQKDCPDGESALADIAGFVEGGLCCR